MTTKEKILQLAREYILQVGYNAFSFTDISTRLGIKNAAIHYYFQGKEVLVKNVVLQEQTQFDEWNRSLTGMDVWEKLHEFFAIYDKRLSERSICMIGSLSSDYNAIPPSIHSELRVLAEKISQWLGQLLLHGREDGKFSFQGNAHDKAVVIVTSLAAGLQVARVLGTEKFDDLKNQIKLDLTPTKI